MTIEPQVLSVDIDDPTSPFEIVAIYSDGAIRTDLEDIVTFEVSPPIAAVSNDGGITPIETGTATVTATVADVTGEAVLVISNPVVAIRLEPQDTTIPEGISVNYSVTALCADGVTREEVTELSDLTVSDETFAAVDDTGSNRITGLAATPDNAPVSVTTTYGELLDMASLTVTPAELSGLVITGDVQTDVGGTARVTVQAEYTDESTRDVTDSVTFAIGEADLLSEVGNGAFVSVEEGTTHITANLGDIYSEPYAITVASVDPPYDGGLGI